MAFRSLIPWKQRTDLARHERRDPFEMLRQEMDRLFEDFHKDFGLAPFGGEEGGWMPRCNVSETENEVKVSAELPGMTEKDIDVSLENEVLTIKGEKKEEKEDKQKNFYRMERSFGSFERSIPLPAGVEMDKAEATFKNGVLTITLPKTKEARTEAKKIEVKGS